MSRLSKLNPMSRHHAHCRHVRGQMSDYLDGELDPAGVREVERHVRWCPMCHRMLNNLRRTVEGLSALRDRQPADSSGPASTP